MSNNVWVLLQQREGELHRMSREAIAAGQKLAAAIGGRASAVLLGAGLGELAKEVAKYDLDAVHTADDAKLADYTPGGYIGALAPALTATAPAYVVAPHSYQSVDYVPRLAAKLGVALVPEVTAFEEQDGAIVWTRPIMGGKLVAKAKVRGEGTVVLTVQSGAFSADGAVLADGATEIQALDASGAAPDREILGVESVGGDQVDLSKASVVVAVGRGVGGADKMGPLEELAKKLGAEIGASRPVIDNGWLPRDRQIGSSGQTVAPKLYIAAGISGAIQHLVGMKGAGCVVAINKDPNAPIMALASYALVGDLHDIVPAINAALEEAGI